MRRLGVTVYGCEPDEARAFTELAPRWGIVPTITSDAVSERSLIRAPANRCISVGHKSEISGPVLRELKQAGVEYLSTRSIGFDHIDLAAADALGIVVENVVYAPDGVADFTLMLMLMAIRNTKQIVRSAENGDFRLGTARGRDLCDLTVGVVGVGHIGNAVIDRLQGFGCRVLANNGDRRTAAAADFVSLDDLLIESDVVTLHVPLIAQTRHLIGPRQIEMMKPGAYLINTGRGALVDTEALIEALESGTLGGAALDVLEGEEGLFYFDCRQRPVQNKLLLRLQELPNALVTPHTAYYTRRALYDTVENTLLNCSTFERKRASAETKGRDLVRGLLGGA
jgi:D-specific alpha-keto acid dehydrogenase